MRVAVIGASKDRNKYGNKAVRAYQGQGHEVLPVNPKEEEIEGLRCYGDVSEVEGRIDRATLYLHPEAGMGVIEKLGARGDVGEIFLNPGSESSELIERARELGLNVVVGCSIVAIGVEP